MLAVYVDSYLFVFSTSVLQIGIGLSSNMAACEFRPLFSCLIFRAAIFMCIFFYCSSKVFNSMPWLIIGRNIPISY